MTIGNRIKETTTSTSTTVIALGGAASADWRTFAAGLPANASGLEVMVGPDSNGAWLIGEYTLTNSYTLSRTAIIDSSAGGADVTLAAGSKEVYNTISAAPMARVLSAANVKATADDTLAAGNLVYIKSTGHCGLADATAEGKEAVAVAVAACASGQPAVLSFSGAVISGLAGLTPGAFYYMSTTPGAMVKAADAPMAASNVLMKVGTAISATQLLFAPETPVTL